MKAIFAPTPTWLRGKDVSSVPDPLNFTTSDVMDGYEPGPPLFPFVPNITESVVTALPYTQAAEALKQHSAANTIC